MVELRLHPAYVRFKNNEVCDNGLSLCAEAQNQPQTPIVQKWKGSTFVFGNLQDFRVVLQERVPQQMTRSEFTRQITKRFNHDSQFLVVSIPLTGSL